jgi:hypothetical protein
MFLGHILAPFKQSIIGEIHWLLEHDIRLLVVVVNFVINRLVFIKLLLRFNNER